jgi:hypothetical protein
MGYLKVDGLYLSGQKIDIIKMEQLIDVGYVNALVKSIIKRLFQKNL